MHQRIYLDYAATTPADPEVTKTMESYFSDRFGNASSVHSFGQQAANAVDEARVTIARFFNCQPTEVVFTSGATESNNSSIKGIVYHYLQSVSSSVGDKSLGLKSEIRNPNFKSNHKSKFPKNIRHSGFGIDSRFPNSSFLIPHIVTTAIEHPSVLESCKALEKLGLSEITYVMPQSNGIVRVEDVIGAIKENTILVSVMYANNEVGTIQPIREIGRKLKEQKEQKETKRYPLFHTDATQAVQFLPCRVDKLGVDLLSMSAHKIYGPKGIGALYVKKGTPIVRFIDGGAQEFDLRAGTLNTPGIVGFGKAVEKVKSQKSIPSTSSGLMLSKVEASKVKSSVNENLTLLRDQFISNLIKTIPNTSLIGDPIHRLPNNINIRFNGVDGQTLVMALDQEGIAASAGSACASGAPEPSHVITAMLDEQAARESVRFTIGKYTTDSEIKKTVTVLQKLVKRIRSTR